MNSLASSTSIILVRHISQKKSELFSESGQEASDVSEEILNLVMNRLLVDSDTLSIAREFQKTPEFCRKELEKILGTLIESDSEFGSKLKDLSDRYSEAIKMHAESIEPIYRNDLDGIGSIAKGKNAIAVTATDKSVAIGSVRGNVTVEGHRAIDANIYIEKNIEGISPETKQNLAQIRYLEEKRNIDSDWEKERVQYLEPDNNGNLNKKIPSYSGAIFKIIFSFLFLGGFWLISENIFSQDFSTFGILFGTVFTFFAFVFFWSGIKEYINTKKYKSAEIAYLNRRARIKQSNLERPNGNGEELDSFLVP